MAERTFFETYTPRNIRDEIAHRFAVWKGRRPPQGPPPESAPAYDGTHAEGVGRFYDAQHDKFLKVYGEVIQAFRTRDVADLLNYQIRSIGFQSGQRVVDAGCGVAAPAMHFARHAGVRVDAITISRSQYETARARVSAEQMDDRVTIVRGDYHRLEAYFRKSAYDVVYFLESFGHSNAKRRAIDSCWEILKPGGVLYIKDLFVRVPLRPEHAPAIDREIRKINNAYHYEIADLNAVLDDVRRKGFMLTSLKGIDFDISAFEDLAISNEFQELTGIAQIEDWSEYVFPVDFFELKCVKPEFDLDSRPDRHFLQNRYHLPKSG